MNTTEKWNGIEAMKHEGYALPKQACNIINKAARAGWQKPFVLAFLTIAFSISDALMLYSVMDVALTQAAWMGTAASLIIALFLNFIPICMAGNIHHAIYRTKRHMWAFSAVLLLAFVMVFSFTVYLRFTYKDIYGDLNTMQLTNTLSSTETTIKADPGKATRSNAVVLLTAFAPLGTSLLNFIMAYYSEDPVKKEKDSIQTRVIELNEAISEVTSGLETMDNLERDLMEQDEKAYAAMRMSLIERAKYLRSYGIQLLEESLSGNPSAISKLTKEAMPQDHTFEEALKELEMEGSFRREKVRPYPTGRVVEEDFGGKCMPQGKTG